MMVKINEMLNNEPHLTYRRNIFDVAVGAEHGKYDSVSEKVSWLFDQIGGLVGISEQLQMLYLNAHVRKTAKAWVALEKWVQKESQKKG